MKIFYRFLFFILFQSLFHSLYGQSTSLISATGNGGFESGTTFAANGWTEVNGTQPNKWYVGTGPTGYTGTRCAFMSKNGTGHSYNINNAAVSHFYR
ncbi:MAG TPA: hypothetical protein PLD84_14630, partial [Chitinophagales bacterium]|nr:hypothetical protein [Chitinophagales bacterium]